MILSGARKEHKKKREPPMDERWWYSRKSKTTFFLPLREFSHIASSVKASGIFGRLQNL